MMLGMVGAAPTKGFGLGVVLTALWLGFRHGIDWDHIAAITDITSSQDERRQSLIFGTLYALGHASVVLVLGVLAILVGEQLPPGVDNVMTRIVGATLILLGVYVFVSLIRHGRTFAFGAGGCWSSRAFGRAFDGRSNGPGHPGTVRLPASTPNRRTRWLEKTRW